MNKILASVLLMILSISSTSQGGVIKTFSGTGPEAEQLRWAIQIQDRPFVCKISNMPNIGEINLREFVESTMTVKDSRTSEIQEYEGARLGRDWLSFWDYFAKNKRPIVKLYRETTPIYEIEYGIERGSIRLRLYTDTSEKYVTKVERTTFDSRAVNLGTLRDPDVQAVPVFSYSMNCVPK